MCLCVVCLSECFRCHACLFPGVCVHVCPCVAGCSLLGKSQLIMQFIVWLCWCGVQRAERGILTGSLAADQMTLMIFLSLFLFQRPTLLFAQSLRLIAHAGVSNFQLWNSGSVFQKRNHSPLPGKPTDRLPNYWSALCKYGYYRALSFHTIASICISSGLFEHLQMFQTPAFSGRMNSGSFKHANS